MKNKIARQPLQTISKTLEEAKERMSAELAQHIDPERFAKIALTAISRKPRLIQACIDSPWSLVLALREAGQLGLEPTGTLGYAYLVPYRSGKTKKLEVQFQPGWRGLAELAMRSGLYTAIEADVVREGDDFVYEKGLHPVLRHVPNLDADQRGTLTHAWAIARLRDRESISPFHVMDSSEIDRVRAHSQAYQKGYGPWIDDEPEMWRKSVVKNLCKYLRKTPELERAMMIDNAVESGDIETLRAMYADADEVPAPKSRVSEVRARLEHKKSERTPEDATPEEEETAKELTDDEIEELEALIERAASHEKNEDGSLLSLDEAESWQLAIEDEDHEIMRDALLTLRFRLGLDAEQDELGF